MQSRWSDREAAGLEELALAAYMTRLLGADADLAMHGGGNTSVKGSYLAPWGEQREALFIKASGRPLDRIAAEDLLPLDILRLRMISRQDDVAETDLAELLRLCLLRPSAKAPSVETLLHALLPGRFICHTHPTAILALTNRAGGREAAVDALGGGVHVLPYVKAGIPLARALRDLPDGARALVLMHHGLVTWADDAREAYRATIECVDRAEQWLGRPGPRIAHAAVDAPEDRYRALAPVLRGQLGRRVLRPLIDQRIAGILGAPGAESWCVTPPPTPDYLIRTRPLPLWLRPDESVAEAVRQYQADYAAYLARHGAESDDTLPRVALVPGLGAICAGMDEPEAEMLCDVTRQSLLVKAAVYESGGTLESLAETHLFEMEQHPMQRAKARVGVPLLGGSVALVTGAAGAVGAGICEVLLEAGCSVALLDNDPDRCAALADALGVPGRTSALCADVTDPASVADAFSAVVRRWGGVDIVVANAGIAHVSPLVTLELEAFRRLSRVNAEGTLLTLAEAARLFERQGSGGDVVLVSTKNVFSPGASFGAYSATKAAAHQLARIASLELAPLGVRVNMVAPDAVFSHGGVRSGLWETVGPDRMKARGLDAKGLEEHYRSRNLLKARVEARHVGNAVLFFVTRQTPTTGATIPVDGGLPDATPR